MATYVLLCENLELHARRYPGIFVQEPFDIALRANPKDVYSLSVVTAMYNLLYQVLRFYIENNGHACMSLRMYDPSNLRLRRSENGLRPS